MNQNENTLYLIDGSGFIFRAFYALPPLTRSDGLQVGAVLGFCNMLAKMLGEIETSHIAVIYDAARKNFRNDIYEEYKANRLETPEELVPQFKLIRKASQSFGLMNVEMDGYEADDLIATYARLASEKGMKTVIIGADKDLMQLVNDSVSLLDPIKQKTIGREEVFEKFGVYPEKVIDVQALAGDSTDNIPGVAGIGIKTAAQLINEFGSLENLLENALSIKQNKRRETLIENSENAIISKKLVTLDQNVPIEISIDEMKARKPEQKTLSAFLHEMGFKSLIARLFPDENISQEQQATENNQSVTVIDDIKILEKWIKKSEENGLIAIDTETTDLNPTKANLCGISLYCEGLGAGYIPLGHKKPAEQNSSLFGEEQDQKQELKQIKLKEAVRLLKPLLENRSVLKIGHNVKYDMQVLRNIGIDLFPVEDTMLISYVLDGTSHGNGLDELAKLYFGRTNISYSDICGSGKKAISFDLVDIKTAAEYAGEDALVTFELYKKLKPRLVQEKMLQVYDDIERPLIYVIATMESEGIKIDLTEIKRLSDDFAIRLHQLEEEIHSIAGTKFNVASPKQIGTILFESMGIEGGKKTKTGDWSTTAGVLEQLSDQGYEIASKILQWRHLAKLKSTYADSLAEKIVPKTGRLHTSYSMAGTTTGRLSSSDPNLQNIPIKTEEGRKIRRAFISPENTKIVCIDYSQVELRLAAEIAGISALQEAFRQNKDIHTLTAAKVFGFNSEEEVTADARRKAKAVNFGIIYGISKWGLAKQLGVSSDDAGYFIDRYLSRFPELIEYMENTKEEARQNGYVRTAYGRKCFIRGINDKNGAVRSGAERQAINAPLQGTAADIMKIAMIRVQNMLSEGGYKTKMMLQVHDEIVLEIPEDELDIVPEKAKVIMESIFAGSVPLIAEIGSGDNWADAH